MSIKEEPCDFWSSEASGVADIGPQAASPPPPSPPPPHPLSPAQTPLSSAVFPAVSTVTCPAQSVALLVPAEPAPAVVKQEMVERPCSSSDEDFNVDSLLNNLGLLGSSEASGGKQAASRPLKQDEVVVKVEPGLGENLELGVKVKVEPGLEVKVGPGPGLEVEVAPGLEVKVEPGLEVEPGLGVKVKVEPGLEVECEAEEVQGEGQQALHPAQPPVKSKSQGKRVTWNIEVPEGPQPEKSASSKCCQATRREWNHSFWFFCFTPQ